MCSVNVDSDTSIEAAVQHFESKSKDMIVETDLLLDICKQAQDEEEIANEKRLAEAIAAVTASLSDKAALVRRLAAESVNKAESNGGNGNGNANRCLWHGQMATTNAELTPPKAAAVTDKLNRSGKEASMPVNGSEYVDTPETLDKKLAYVAQLLRKAQGDTVVYSGAGLSTASGIKDYASVAGDSIVRKNYGTSEAAGSRLDLKPSLGHHAVAALWKKKMVGHWVNQNHDRLSQKAGFPQEKLIEIHGAWGDHKNPVASFNDALRRDLLEWLWELCEAGPKVCLVLGSSLCGMNADQIVEASEDVVIIGTGPTPYDERCSVRIWGLLDDVLSRLYTRHVCADEKVAANKKLPNPECLSRGQAWVRQHPSCRYHTPVRKAGTVVTSTKRDTSSDILESSATAQTQVQEQPKVKAVDAEQ